MTIATVAEFDDEQKQFLFHTVLFEQEEDGVTETSSASEVSLQAEG